jgi:hypothetical protein
MEPTPENMQHLGNFLGQTLSPDPATRKGAEAQLSQAKVQAGYSLLLLRLIVTDSYPSEIRLQAAIQFKNLVNQHWSASEVHDYHLCEQDQKNIKARIGPLPLTEKPSRLPPNTCKQGNIADASPHDDCRALRPMHAAELHRLPCLPHSFSSLL